jgi:spore coat protein CotF
MSNLMSSFFSSTTDKSPDETIALTSMAGAAGSATAYLGATLEATTPEVRRLFSEYCTQSILGHEALTTLAMTKRWFSPNTAPETQLQMSVSKSQGSAE